MKLLKKALIYDISNMAYMIADTGDNHHTLHRVRDICEEGNISRVSRILGSAYATILNLLSPILEASGLNPDRDLSAKPRDYEIKFKSGLNFRHSITPEIKLRIKEMSHEYMMSMVLADWLAMTLPPAADVWKFRAENAIDSLSGILLSVVSSGSGVLRRRVSPI